MKKEFNMKAKKQFNFKKAQNGLRNQPVELMPTDSFDPSKLPFSQKPGNLVRAKGKKNPVGDFFDVFNPLAMGATAFANTVTDYKNRAEEQRNYINYLQSRGYENFNENGLNPNPIYTQYGGDITSIPYVEYNGERCTIPTYQLGGESISFINSDGERVTYPTYQVGGTYPMYEDGGRVTYPTYENGGYSRQEILDYLKQWDGYSVAWMGKGGKNWIPKDLHKGRCTPMGTPECPPGSPQYNLAKTFKKHHGFHQFGGHPQKMLPVDMFGNVQKYPYGGGPLTSEGAKEILRDGTVHGHPLSPAQKRYFGYIAGGGKPHQMGGASAPLIEAEGGESYMTPDSRIKKIPDSAPSHEQGGVPINDAERVLEDTSTSRNDADSQTLKLAPEQATALTGVKFDKPVSHSQALEDATKHYGKFTFKINKKIEKNLKTLDKNKLDKYATNTLNLNMAHLQQIPTDGELFDNLFQHQELVKQLAGIDQTQMSMYGGKYCMGGEYGKGGMNFKSKGAYKKWLAFGHIHKAFEKTPGNQAVSIKGQEHEVKHAQTGIYNRPGGHYYPAFDNGQGSVSTNKVRLVRRPDGKVVPTFVPENKQLSSQRVDLLPTDNFNSPNVPFTSDSGVDVNSGAGASNTYGRFNFNQPKSDFNEPLHWYDVAGPLGNYLSASDRIPAQFNPVQLNQIRMQLQNPQPALQAGQEDYNAALRSIPNTGAGVANVSRLFGSKYNLDNQILGQYENINKGIKNQETEYNANVKDRQAIADQQARATFEQQFLGSIEAQRQQKLDALNSLYDKFAQNRALNRNANLIMKLAPAYDENGNFNGYKRYFFNPGANTIGTPTQTKKTKS